MDGIRVKASVAAMLSIATLYAGSAQAAQTLTTPRYVVTIEEHCEEGEVGCADVSYRGVNRKTGKAITLKGRTRMVLCKDGVTPCHIGAYEFRNGAVLYSVFPDGNLVVTQAGKVVLREAGKWSY